MAAPVTNGNGVTSLPLEGVRVLDFTQVMMGPCCTQMLGDYGADVIKIERAGMGDLSRWSVGEDPDGGNNPVFASLNRNKRSLALDLKSESDREVVRRLVETADVVVNNFRPGVMERMGFGYEDLKRINPRIIWAMGSGYGPDGPYVRKGKGGQDVLAQAMTGAMHRRSGPEIPLSVYPTALADYAAGMHLVQGILLALLQRGRTGEGQRISVSLYNSMLAMQMQEAAMHLMRGRELNWAAYPLSGVFETTDGAIVMVGHSRRTRSETSVERSISTTCRGTRDTRATSGRRRTAWSSRRSFERSSRPARPPTGWSDSRTSTSCARRSCRSRKRSPIPRPRSTG